MMSITRIGRFVCDRCGVSEDVPFGGQYVDWPKGWGNGYSRRSYRGSGKADMTMCAQCLSEYTMWWDAPKEQTVDAQR